MGSAHSGNERREQFARTHQHERPNMPIRFSTVAANADFLCEDAAPEGAPEATQPLGAGSAPRARGERGSRPSRQGDARPGKDINAPGFIKDKDDSKP
jgi:hypothetical protein